MENGKSICKENLYRWDNWWLERVGSLILTSHRWSRSLQLLPCPDVGDRHGDGSVAQYRCVLCYQGIGTNNRTGTMQQSAFYFSSCLRTIDNPQSYHHRIRDPTQLIPDSTRSSIFAQSITCSLRTCSWRGHPDWRLHGWLVRRDVFPTLSQHHLSPQRY